MTNQEILDNAPEDATHVDVNGGYWNWPVEGDDYWMVYINFRWEYKRVDHSMRSLSDIRRIAELEALCKECADHLDTNPFGAIWEDSYLHRDLKKQAGREVK